MPGIGKGNKHQVTSPKLFKQAGCFYHSSPYHTIRYVQRNDLNTRTKVNTEIPSFKQNPECTFCQHIHSKSFTENEESSSETRLQNSHFGKKYEAKSQMGS